MKFRLLILFLVMFTTVNAQFVKRTNPRKDSVVNAQTRYLEIPYVTRGATGAQLTWIKASGFIKGTAVLQRQIDTLSVASSTWVTTGSTFTFTNGVDETYIWPITVVDGTKYRIKVVTVDSTQKAYLYGVLIRQ